MPHNLPLPLPPLVGRERELARIGSRLRAPGTRLLTLTGIGGVGKTRLALAVAEATLAQFSEGVWLVLLAPLQDPTLLVSTIAQELGVREAGGSSLEDQLVAHLRPRQLLLVLDNCAHLRDTCATLAGALLGGCPGLQVLVTSRAPLRLPGERRFAVPPLTLPAEGTAPADGVEAVAASPAVALFVARAQAVEPAFTLDAGNAAAVAHICRRLDGLPLALELAATRLKGHSPAVLLDELGERLHALASGSHRREARQRTLRALLDWSYTLLGAGEQALFARLSAFAGGWTLEAAAAVCVLDDDLPFPVAEGLASLAEQSLVQGPDLAGRYTMLETVREYAGYALARLAAPEDGERARHQHADYVLRLAEEAVPALQGPEQVTWLARLEAEHDNARAALHWSLDVGEIELGLRLAAALWRFWWLRGHVSEGRQWLAAALAEDEAARATPAVRARALHGAGSLALLQGDLTQARTLLDESLARKRELGDVRGIAVSLNSLATVARNQGDYARARALHEECLALLRELDDTWGIATSLGNLGVVVADQGDLAHARALHEESLALRRELGDTWGIASSLANLGLAAAQLGDLAHARALLEESVALDRELGHKWGIASSLNDLASVALRQGDLARARALLEESLALWRELGDKAGTALALEGFAHLARVRGQPQRAVQLWGAGEALRRTLGAPRAPSKQAEYEQALAGLRAALSAEGTFDAAWAAGQALTPDQAIATALEVGPPAG